MDKVCKGCSENIITQRSISQQEIDDAINKLAKGKHIRLVEEALYAFRLQLCQSCQHLEFNTTCLKCGCIVQIRAKLADAACPLSKGKKW